MILDAAKLANLNVLSFMHDTTAGMVAPCLLLNKLHSQCKRALWCVWCQSRFGLSSPFCTAALQFGVQQRGFNNETNVVVFDMGSSKLEVGVFTFTPRPEEPDANKKRKMDAVGLGMCGVVLALR